MSLRGLPMPTKEDFFWGDWPPPLPLGGLTEILVTSILPNPVAFDVGTPPNVLGLDAKGFDFLLRSRSSTVRSNASLFSSGEEEADDDDDDADEGEAGEEEEEEDPPPGPSVSMRIDPRFVGGDIASETVVVFVVVVVVVGLRRLRRRRRRSGGIGGVPSRRRSRRRRRRRREEEEGRGGRRARPAGTVPTRRRSPLSRPRSHRSKRFRHIPRRRTDQRRIEQRKFASDIENPMHRSRSEHPGLEMFGLSIRSGRRTLERGRVLSELEGEISDSARFDRYEEDIQQGDRSTVVEIESKLGEERSGR
mmetsp:Transcript_6857/g.14402  ORF Transcript_6857/g.14402 Transcript_6857/m.14402 type:complete len:306 (-) Transcript_6857:321-1238(-)